jgi:hypothetical protein
MRKIGSVYCIGYTYVYGTSLEPDARPDSQWTPVEEWKGSLEVHIRIYTILAPRQSVPAI